MTPPPPVGSATPFLPIDSTQLPPFHD
jgi:hypothetical protein